ncbi:syntaxin-1A-like isoform X2 [Neocloeon triangulifer]|uniref:syntaxin-1A-like isoform X2 n=1 Tax=Neocloeon triangulifer TaxID=2078957 RepID=UPI00286FA50B|nr:syntaxin-1A-like isoform X2 [Neocloeon triangulifer]
MVRDRLKALQATRDELEAAGELPEVTDPYVYEQHIDIDEDEENEDSLHKFFLKAQTVRSWIETAENHTKEMRRLQSTILSSPRPDELAKTELEDRMAAIKMTSNQIRVALKELAESVARAEVKANGRPSATLRIRKTQYQALSRVFSDTLIAYNTSQLKYREDCKERIRRQLRIANRETTDDELEKMLENGDVAVFTGDIVVQTQEARQALADVEARHKEIMKLEKNIMELRDLFIEMASLVATQGDMIDRIETHVLSAGEAVSEAAKQTKKAVVYRSKARKKKIIIIAVLIVILIIVALIIVFSVVPMPSSKGSTSSTSNCGASGCSTLSATTLRPVRS